MRSGLAPHVRSALCAWIAALALIAWGLYLRRDAIATGFVADDFAQLSMLDGSYPLQRPAYDLFNFSNGSRSDVARLIDSGFYPWWSDPELRLAMFRPLASLLTALEFRVFGDDPWGYHVCSAVWWAAMALAVFALFRRVLSPAPALLAFAFFVCDEAHGVILAWACNSAALLSTWLAVLALWLTLRSRGRAQRVLALLAYVLALACGEYALAALAYFVAYVWLGGAGGWLRACLPLMAAALVYVVLRALIGHGVSGSGVYVEALRSPLAFAAAVLVRAPVLVADMLIALRADYYTFGAPFVWWAFDRGWVSERWLHTPEPWRAIQVVCGVLASAATAWLAFWTLRHARGARQLRWLCVGSLLALVPVCGSFPSSRLTLPASLGFLPLMAAFVIGVVERAWPALRGPSALRARVRAGAATAFACAFALYHVIVPSSLEQSAAAGARASSERVQRAVLHTALDEARLPERDLVLLCAFDGGTSLYLPLVRARYARSLPRSTHVLAFVHAPGVLSRTAADSFSLRFAGDDSMLVSAGEQLFRGHERPLRRGDSVRVGPMRVTVLELFEGRPKQLGVQLDGSLDDPRWLFAVPTDAGLRPFQLPERGASVRVPPPVIPDVGP
jgi:hypothetical protein